MFRFFHGEKNERIKEKLRLKHIEALPKFETLAELYNYEKTFLIRPARFSLGKDLPGFENLTGLVLTSERVMVMGYYNRSVFIPSLPGPLVRLKAESNLFKI